jgi:beta-glucanase (GH16 family)
MQNQFKMFSILPLLCAALFACTEKKEIPVLSPAEQPIDKNWAFETTPMWEDNFSTNGNPDVTKWGFDVGGSGWGNNELQYYTSSGNARIENGILSIDAKKENNSGMQYTSARMITKGKGDFLYGRIEVRAKLPKGRGTWPAIWTLSTDQEYGTWPASGEIDIMEHVGYDPNKVHSSVHTTAFNHIKNTQKTAFKMIPDATDAFHIYRIDWTPYAIRSYIDGQMYFEFVNEGTGFTTWPFNKKQHLLLNIAVGGNWGGVQGVDNTIFPATMQVDYVRVYKMIP